MKETTTVVVMDESSDKEFLNCKILNGNSPPKILVSNGRQLNGAAKTNGHLKTEENNFHSKSDNESKMKSQNNSNGNTQECHNREKDQSQQSEILKEPPDGGIRAWTVMLSAFLCNGVIFGIINTYGVIHSYLQDKLTEQNDSEASSKAALVGSLTIGTTFLLSPVAGVLTDKIGLRMTTFIGGCLCGSGMLLSSFFNQNIKVLYFTYGIMFGMGAALAYTPTLAILGHYFKRYLGKVNGFVTAGSSVFTAIMPLGLDYLIKYKGLGATLQAMALLSSIIVFSSIVYRPLHTPPPPPKKKPGRSQCSMIFRSIVNVDIWKRKRYVIWALSVPLALFGYFVPYVHMVKFVQTAFPGKSANLPVMCIGVSSGIGRLIFGILADLPQINRIFLQQISLTLIGVLTMLLPATDSYSLLIVFTLLMGLFDGCFISILGPLAYEICGPHGATQAIGFLLGLSSLPLTIGPPIAGKLFDHTKSYTLPLILAGIPPIIGASIMTLTRCVKDAPLSNGVTATENGTNTTMTKFAWDETGQKLEMATANGHSMNEEEHQLKDTTSTVYTPLKRKASLATAGTISSKSALLKNISMSALTKESCIMNIKSPTNFSESRQYNYSVF